MPEKSDPKPVKPTPEQRAYAAWVLEKADFVPFPTPVPKDPRVPDGPAYGGCRRARAKEGSARHAALQAELATAQSAADGQAVPRDWPGARCLAIASGWHAEEAKKTTQNQPAEG